MDTTQDIIYRNFKLNDRSVADRINNSDGLAKGISGCVVDEFDPDDVDIVQFTEKKAETDGMDVGRPFLGARRIRLSGTVYGVTRALAYDILFQLRAVMNPVLAARESPGDNGYVPLYFAVPTNDVANFPGGAITMQALCMPKAFHAPINRDSQGGSDSDALAIPWTAVMTMREPFFENETPQDVAFNTSVSGNFLNRGTYNAPLNMLISVGSGAGTIAVSVAGSVFLITIPSSTGNRILRFKREKIFTVQEGGIESLRRSWLSFQQSTTWPLIPAGTSAYNVTVTGAVIDPGAADGTHMWFWEAYA